MKGLLYKDACTLVRQVGIMLALVVLFGCVQRGSMTAVAIFYASLLPMTALAYDERCKWDTMAAGMPYSDLALVGSKYALGGVCVAGAMAVCLLAQLAFGSFRAEDAVSTLLIALLAFALNVIELPVMFRFGVEKGRLVFLLLTCGGVSAILVWRDQFIDTLDRIENPAAMLLVLAGAVAALTAVSLPLAVRMYRGRYRR